MASSNPRTRSTILQSPVPAGVRLPSSTERSVVSDLTSPGSARDAAGLNGLTNNAGEEDISDDDIFEQEKVKDVNGGDGCDSDEEGDECLIHRDGCLNIEKEVEKEVNHDHNGNEPSFESFAFGRKKGYVDLTNSSGGKLGNIIFAEGDVSNVEIEKDLAGKDVKIQQPPKDWLPGRAQGERGEPNFIDIDNPGEWPQYCYRPVFNSQAKTSKYKHHCLPSGAMPVPENKDGKRNVNGWEFHYNGWKNEGFKHRHGATRANMFPEELKGCLDAGILAKLGLTKKRMGLGGVMDAEVDALFFYQLILPICNPQFSGIQDDPRKSYYHEVEKFTNTSKLNSGLGVSYGHHWNLTSAKELVNLDGILIHDGVLGSTQGALYRRWDQRSPCYSKDIASVMTLSRCGELRRSMKLCNNDTAPKRGERKCEMTTSYQLKLEFTQ